MKKCLQNVNIKDKTVILRVDFNVPLKNGEILDDTKIVLALETINYILSQNCRLVILSHLGKVKTEADKYKYSLQPIANKLKELINKEVYFIKETDGLELKKRIENAKPQDVLMLENTRYFDVPDKLESACDIQLSMLFASLGDIYVNDAFATSHRKHASNYGIAEHIPSCIGFLMQKEINILNQLIMNQDKKMTIVMGGAKVDDKIKLVENLIPKSKHFLCGGAIANTCLKSLDINVGSSLVTNNYFAVEKLKKVMFDHKEKIMLPLDCIVGSTFDQNYVKYKKITEVDDNDIILDIGIKTLEKYKKAIDDSEVIFLNGTMGLYEDMRFANGTKEFLKMLAESDAITVVGGGDSASSVKKLGFENKLTYVSSGGGATLDYIATGKLIALEPVEEELEIEVLDL